MSDEKTRELVSQASEGFNAARRQALDAGLSVVESGSAHKNEDVLMNFVNANAPEKISKEWVIWAFALLRNAKGKTLNPDWLECSVNITRVENGYEAEPFW